MSEKRALWAADSQDKHWTGPKISLGVIKMDVKIRLKWTSEELKLELRERRTTEAGKKVTMENKRKEHYKDNLLYKYLRFGQTSNFHPEDLYISCK